MSGKSKDPNNYICELFKEGVIGSDIKISVLMIMNQIKRQMCVPMLKNSTHHIIAQERIKIKSKQLEGFFSVFSVENNPHETSV